MLLYIYSGNSLRAVEKSMEVFNFVFPFLDLNVPSYVTVRDWVLKAGLDTYAHRCKNLPVDEAYAIVMDESITIAEHKILLSLKTPAQHPGKPLAHADVEVIDIRVARSHNSSDIADAVDRITDTVGHAPEYAVTDNGTSLAKGLRDAGLDGHRDSATPSARSLRPSMTGTSSMSPLPRPSAMPDTTPLPTWTI